MKRFLALVLLGLLALAAPLREVVVEGGDPVLQALARAALPFGEGDEPGDLEAARKAILATGYFREVRVSLEGDTLKVVLFPYPALAEVKVEAKAFPQETLLRFLEENFAIGKGATYNPLKAQEAAQALAQAFRQNGFPFAPKVEVEAKEVEGGMALTFRVAESPEVKEVRLAGVSLLPQEELLKLLEPLKGPFDFAKYQEALRAIARRYEEAGYRFSGPDAQGSALEAGVLTVRVRELKVARVEGEGLDLGDFPLKPGDYLNYAKLLEGVQNLSRRLSRVVNFTLLPEGESVVVRLETGPEGGRIERVELQGNTAFPTETLLALLRLKPGEVYTPALAQEDARRLAQYYGERGLEVADVRFGFQEGVYRLEVVELKIAGYRLEWQGDHRTQEEVILRELPKAGSLFSVPELRRAIARLMATGLLAEPPGVRLAPGEKEDQVVVVLSLKEARTGLFQPALGWSSLEGWSGSLSFKETNLFGLAHQVSLDLAFVQNDARDNLSLSLGYAIPWLYLDYLDLKEVRTSLSLSAFSTPIGNNKLLQGTTDTGWEYTERRTGAAFSLSRPFSKDLENLRLTLGLSARRSTYALEVYDPNAPCDPSVSDTANPRYCDGTGYKDPSLAQSLLPTPGWTVRLDTTLGYLDVDDPRFRTQGYEASLATGLGLSLPDTGGRSFFVPLVATGKTYLPLDGEKRQALAFRLSAGTLLGFPPESERFYLSGGGAEAFLLRGYEDRKYGGLSFATGSVEYRYNFNLSPQGGTNLYGIVFADLGLADNTGGVKWGAGIGFQLDLDVFGALLPSLRLDYAFSPESPTGRLHFRIGPMF
ncbi:outer membrane protein insertion porin family [Thermus arciformis]|uniref:Outer membrane protein insertion porin family n=1 Tax=Thermus arciformis TaxID=482827 RepID=A0A1G7KBB6_9DEIN|nr:POTRA domain-containing protein [Thermus arciformis]SDF34465.1 outer membrane protein insertion porin family [Thermus arciformis]